MFCSLITKFIHVFLCTHTCTRILYIEMSIYLLLMNDYDEFCWCTHVWVWNNYSYSFFKSSMLKEEETMGSMREVMIINMVLKLIFSPLSHVPYDHIFVPKWICIPYTHNQGVRKYWIFNHLLVYFCGFYCKWFLLWPYFFLAD